VRESPWAAADLDAQPQHSPARALQHELARRLAQDEAPRWSPRRTLLFILVTCGSFWLATALVIGRLLR